MEQVAQDALVSLVQTIVEPLVRHPEDAHVSAVDDEGTLVIEIRTHKEDGGRIIGNRGRTINAMRTLARAAASSYDAMRVEVELIDEDEPAE